MRLLLDSCTFLWAALEPERLSATALKAVRDPDNDVLLSAVSGWEIAVKYALGRLRLDEPPARFVPKYREAQQIEALPLTEEAALHVHLLPALHQDPFDRMLVCQAIVGGLVLVTPDPAIRDYPVRTLW
jgi:PIN domain nuclease of toxin-antitoxin system